MRALMTALVIALALYGSARSEAESLAGPPSTVSREDSSSETGPVERGTKALVVVLGALAALFGVLLYVVPARVVEVTRRRVESSMTARAITLAEEDRRRIARELHDGVGQALTAARLQLAALRQNVAGHRDEIEQILACVDEAMNEVRHSTTALAPPALAEFGLRGALERHCESFASASRLPVRFDAPLPLPTLPAFTEATCYRIVQEALHNAVRHSGASHAWVRLDASPSSLRLEIGDDGPGLPARGRTGLGLDSIRERARLAAATVEFFDRPGAGARVVVLLPIGGPAS